MAEYNPAVLQGRVQPGEMEQFFNQLRKCPNFKNQAKKWVLLAIPLAMLVMCVFMVMAFSSASKQASSGNAGQSNDGPNFALIVIGMLVLFACTASAMCYFGHTRQKSWQARQTELTNVCNQANQSSFNSKETRWTCGKLGAWLTLELDFIAKNLAGVPAMGMGGTHQMTPANMISRQGMNGGFGKF